MTDINTYTKSAFLLLLMLLAAWPQQAFAMIDKPVTVPFRLINGMIILDAQVDGQEGSFLLDTGADAILIDGNPKTTNGALQTLGGEVKMASKLLKHFKIGAFEQYEVDAQIISLAVLEKQLGIDLYGIIGGSFFMPSTLLMDFSTSKMTITATAASDLVEKNRTALPFMVVNQVPVVNVIIEGQSYDLALDSGASIHFLDQKVLQQLSSVSKRTERSSVTSVNHTNALSERYVLPKFTLGKISFSGHHCLSQDFSEINSTLERPIMGILSLSLLVPNGQVIIDFKHQVFYL